MGSSTEGPSATARMRHPDPVWHTPHTFRGPKGSSTEGPNATARMRPHTPISAHLSHVPWPQMELHRRP
eukprot:6003501-Pyramimonas_sp.AAC.1